MIQEQIHVALLDDHTLVRKALKNLITNANLVTHPAKLDVTIDAERPEDFFHQLECNTKVDVLLLDLRIPGITPEMILDTIKKKYSFIRVIIVSSTNDSRIICDLLDQGILGYVFKGAEPSQLIDAVFSAYQNRLYQNKILTDALYWKTRNAFNNENKPVYLTETDKKVLSLLWKEKSTREIAAEIFLSVSSVEKIKQVLKEKVGVKTTIGLIRYAIERKIILMDPTTQ